MAPNAADAIMLAGVLKFNSTLKSLEVKRMGLDDSGAANFYYALLENKTLEDLNISENAVGPVGVAKLSEGVREHPALTTFNVDGVALPVTQVRGGTARLDVGEWALGPLSGYAIGAIATKSTNLTEIDLKHNALGAPGAAAVVKGLIEAPVKTLNISHNNIAPERDPETDLGAVPKSSMVTLGGLPSVTSTKEPRNAQSARAVGTPCTDLAQRTHCTRHAGLSNAAPLAAIIIVTNITVRRW